MTDNRVTLDSWAPLLIGIQSAQKEKQKWGQKTSLSLSSDLPDVANTKSEGSNTNIRPSDAFLPLHGCSQTSKQSEDEDKGQSMGDGINEQKERTRTSAVPPLPMPALCMWPLLPIR